MNSKTMESILARSFPKSISFSTIEVIELLRTKERISPRELSDSAVYGHMRKLLSARKLLISHVTQRSNNRPMTHYQITDLLDKICLTNNWFGNPIGIYLQEVFNNLNRRN